MTLASKDHNCDNEDDDINDIDDTDDDRYGFNACLTCCHVACWQRYSQLLLRYGFYDQEGKLQVVNYSADPQKVILNIIIHDKYLAVLALYL